jgi:heat shock protein beta
LLTGCDSLIIIDLTIYCDDTDGDGIPDVDDDDNDNDGISDDDEGTGDSDGDGIPDYLDIDSDNDGIYDVVESGNGNLDTNDDGVLNQDDLGYVDVDKNGMHDDSNLFSIIELDGNTVFGAENDFVDTDGDGTPDHLDIDSDDDGVDDSDDMCPMISNPDQLDTAVGQLSHASPIPSPSVSS